MAGTWSERDGNPVSGLIAILTWLAVVILLLGIVLIWQDANTTNTIVHPIVKAGRWLATPFNTVFGGGNAKKRLYEDWGLAAAVYLIVGHFLSYITRW